MGRRTGDSRIDEGVKVQICSDLGLVLIFQHLDFIDLEVSAAAGTELTSLVDNPDNLGLQIELETEETGVENRENGKVAGRGGQRARQMGIAGSLDQCLHDLRSGMLLCERQRQ